MSKLRCHKCGAIIPMPTERQIEAYRLVHIFQCTHKQAAIIMGISRRVVSRHLGSLEKKRPDLFGPINEHIKGKNALSFNPDLDSEPKYKF